LARALTAFGNAGNDFGARLGDPTFVADSAKGRYPYLSLNADFDVGNQQYTSF
jgi:hypothetical protein